MSTLRRLLTEVHRRSLWQVLGIYGVGAWVVLQVVDLLAENLGLPEWTFPLAMILLLIGLPVVLATALVQRGVGPRERNEREPGSEVGEGSASPALPPARPPAVHHRFFTWRNALAGGIGAFALWGFAAAVYVSAGRVTGESTDQEPMLAVLPFENLGDPADAYFADGMADDIRGRLAALPGLRVIAPGSVERYRQSEESPDAIARQLGATHLLIARVRWNRPATGPSRVRVTPELIAVDRDGHATVQWQTSVDAVIEDVFRVQADIAAQVSRGLDLVFGRRDRDRLAARPTDDLEAYDAYLRGTEVMRVNSGNDLAALRRAVAFFERAVALDPSFAEAWAALSHAFSTLYVNGTRPGDLRASALHAAQRALEFDPELPRSYSAMSQFHNTQGDTRLAAEMAERGLRHGPRDPELLRAAARADRALGRMGRALERLDLARQIDPLNTAVATARQLALIALRRYDEAIADGRRTLTDEPGNLDAIENTVLAYLGRGDIAGARAFLQGAARHVEPSALVAFFGLYWDLYWILDDEQQRLLLTLPPTAFDDNRGNWGLLRAQLLHHRGARDTARAWGDSAAAAYREALREDPHNAGLDVYIGLALAYAGRADEAIAAAERGVSRMPEESWFLTYFRHQLARVYLLTGRHEQALDVLEDLLRTPYHLSPGWLRVDPNFDPLRAHPRFGRLAGEAPAPAVEAP